MRNMIYGLNITYETLANGNYNGYNWYVVNYSSYPACYIFLPRDSKFYQQSKNNIPIKSMNIDGTGISVRGIDESGWYISWQYRNADDYYMLTFNDVHDGIKHTTAEMVEDCKRVINEIISLSNK